MLDVKLKSDRDRSLKRGHPWILSGAVAEVTGDAEPGAWVRVSSAQGEVLAYGHYSPASAIRVRILTFGKEASDEEVLRERIAAAVVRRAQMALFGETDALRLINAEGDGLPGLVADRYGDVVVVRLSSAGMVRRREWIARYLAEVTGAGAGFERADATAARRENFAQRSGTLWGTVPELLLSIRERGRHYLVDVAAGQKTGFYLDQREARDRVESLAQGKRVLDLFAYTGGFSVAAARGGASGVTAVETSEAACQLARRHLELNAPVVPFHAVRDDAFAFLRREAGPWDLLIADPPPLAKHKSDVPRAARAYKDLFLWLFRRAAENALVLAFCCSHHVGPEHFLKIAQSAARDAEREVQVLAELGASPDHPVALQHPEGRYLSGLLLRVF